jgi:integrase
MFPTKKQNQNGTQDPDEWIDLPLGLEDDMGQLALVQPSNFLDPLEHTANHKNCPACMAADSALQGVKVNFAKMLFSDIDEEGVDHGAGARWMLLRRQDEKLKPRTHEATQGYIDALGKFFGALRLCDITPGHVRGYQLARLRNQVRIAGQEVAPWQHPAGNMLVNHELSVLAQMLRHCRLWQNRIQPFYFPLATKNWSPRQILSEADEAQLFQIAAKHPEASLAYCIAVITNNTTASGLELRGLRLSNLFLPADGIAEIYVPEDSVKNNSRPRKIPLNAEARWAVEQCFRRALKLGSCEPDHYLFPFRVLRNRYDPTRPASRSWLRKSWAKLRKVTGFTELKPHDLRHHCITRMLENDVNPETVIAIAGHVGRKMLEYYAHQRTRVKYAAVCTIETKKTVKRLTDGN